MSFCGECGNKINPESIFCQECGTKIDNSIIIDDISNDIDTQNEIEEPNTSTKQLFKDPQPVSKTSFGSELSSIPSKIEPLTKYIKGYSYVLMWIYAATSIVLISSIIHIIVNIGVIAVIFNFVRYLESNFEKSKKYFNGLFAIMIYQIFDSLSIESDLSLTVNFLNYSFGGFFIFLIFFLIPVIIVSILNSKHLEQNTLSLVDVPNNKSSVDKITKIPNYNQLVEMKSMNKLPKTTPLTIVQVINYLTILGILFMAIIFIVIALIFEFEESIIFIIIATIILLLTMIYFIRGLNRYDNQTKNIYLILPMIQALSTLSIIIDDFEIPFFLSLIFPGIIIYALVYHKPTSDYFKL